ncbi:MAG: hypothetical protein ACRYG4_07545 [Janthinobacterium lividum]
MFSAIDVDLEEHIRPQRERHGITSESIGRHLAAAMAAASAYDAASLDPDRSRTNGHHPLDE